MKIKKTISITCLFLLPALAIAVDNRDELQTLKRQVEELNQRIKILERSRGADAETDASQLIDSHAANNEALAAKFKTPDWVNSVKLLGDLRLRYDGVYAPDSDFVTRWRIRPRLRVGAVATLKNDWEIGFRLASTPSVGKDSGGDPLSTNQTFEDNGSRKPVGVDWAFARWTPIKDGHWTGSFAAGKLENPPNYSENIFDVDYTPEGLAEQFAYKPNSEHVFSVYFGQYMLDELQFSERDPFLFLEQLRAESKWGDDITSAVTVSGLSILNPESLASANVPDSNHGNTRNAEGVLLNDYQLGIVDGSIVYHLDSFPTYKGQFPIKFSAEYIRNFGASSDNTGYSFGPSFGRVTQTGKADKGNWEISYRYQELQGDANYEELTASDNGAFYRSRPIGEPDAGSFRPQFLNGLNLRGHAFRFAYAATDSLVIDARIWLNEAIKIATRNHNPQGVRLLVDLVWKF